MNTFDRHLLREWLQILFLVLAATLGLLVVQICYDKLPDMLENGAHLGDVLRYIGVTMPQFFALVLPIAILISLLYALGKLRQANELTAMRAAGVGFGRLMLPIWVLGLGSCALVWWLNSSVVPWSVEMSNKVGDQVEFRKQSRSLQADKVGAIYDVAFDSPSTGRLWFFNRFSRSTGRGYGASVTQAGQGPFPSQQIWAAEAAPALHGGGWVFYHGRTVGFDPDSGEERESRPFVEKTMPDYHEDPNLMLLTGERTRDLSLFELHRMMAYYRVQNPPMEVPYAVRYYSILADALGPLIVIAIAIPFAVTGVRVNPVVGVAKSIGLFFLYYLLNAAATSLATKGWLDPQWAAWMPNAAMGGLALWFFRGIR